MDVGMNATTDGEKGMKAAIHRLRSMADGRKDDGVMLVVQAAERYEFVRTLAPIRFAELFQESLRGNLSFDQIIDKEIQARMGWHRKMTTPIVQGPGD